MKSDGTSTHSGKLLGEAFLSHDKAGRPQLVGALCEACRTAFFPPAEVCPSCASEEVVDEPFPLTGTIYTLSTVHVAASVWDVPYTIGYVDLPNGARVFSHFKGDVGIGTEVELSRAVVGKDLEGAKIESFVFVPVEA